MVTWNQVLIAFFLLVIIVSAGCITINLGGGNGAVPGTTLITPTPTMASVNIVTPLPTTTKNIDLWTTVVENSYILKAIGGNFNYIDIPIIGNSAYRFSLSGTGRLTVRTNSKIIAGGVTNYNGIFKTGPGDNNIHIEWVYFANEPNVIGTSQNVNVKLERYQGDPSIFPDTTNAPESYRQYN